MDDIFNSDFIVDELEAMPKMTKDEFILKTRAMLQKVWDGYGNHWHNKFNEDDESEENTCTRCGGFTQIEQGGETVDCTNCGGTGMNSERVFDTETFMEFFEHEVMFGNEPFFDLIHCEIVEPKPDDSNGI